MVINRGGDMKRKRKEECPSPILDDSPKRTKVHAQRKFAQGSNVNSPVITPVKEIEKQQVDVIPEPVELLPIKRPNTEDFLTFLCFRGTPILPPNLNFFNTASIVDTNGQVHEIKSESPRNGPIDTSSISKVSGSSERPFVAFGVRKRADPIVISRQMDKKRRHALALQALRRKYQEQKMAKIRAVTISKLSEKVTNKTMVKTNSVAKTDKNTIQKTKVVATKHVKVTTRTVKTTLRPQVKQKMCLRSFRGRFVQKELQFRNNVKKKDLPEKKVKKVEEDVNSESESEYSTDDDKPLSKDIKLSPKVILTKVANKSPLAPQKPAENNFRVTRSNKFLNNKISSRRQQIKQRMILSSPTKPIVKPRTLRSHIKPTETKIVKSIKETSKKVHSKKEITNYKKATNIKKEVKVHVSKVLKKSPKAVEVKKKPPPPTVKQVEVKLKKEVFNKKPFVQIKKIERKESCKKDRKSPEKEMKITETTKKEDEKKTSKIMEQKEMELKSQRPTRKTKEAAAIYMEILSHKLVNDSKIDDDDNISIDSFPELPNVKRTEQRENELKAKAKSAKRGMTKMKTRRTEDVIEEEPTDQSDENSTCLSSDDLKKETKTKKKVYVKNKNEDKPKTRSATNKTENEDIKRMSNKRKSCKETDSESSVVESVKIKSRKSDDLKSNKTESEVTKRQTRSSQNVKQTSSDSDESFHIDIRIPRKKQVTRSKGKTIRDDESSLKTNYFYKEFSSSDDDLSTTSDMKIVKSSKSKRFTKTRSKKSDQSFSDSDEEPLSKFKQAKTEENDNKMETTQVKPKRECAKRPQNYLPMFSSSDDEDRFFLGFTLKPEVKKTNEANLQDLSCKDMGRRFGKGKVNMSNEQIEKWLKDSAMAGNSLKKENDEMLKFGERIPTETSLNMANVIDTQKLKRTLLANFESKSETEKKDDSVAKTVIMEKPQKIVSKPVVIDRKLIFRKDKISPTIPNANAFSASNESSVYAFGEDNEVVMKTPFRRPSRRPSSTATSRSEDESSKYEEMIKSGQFRKPSVVSLTKSEDKELTETEDSNDRCFGIPLPKSSAKVRKSSNDKMVPPRNKVEIKKIGTRNFDRFSETSEEFKYKIPSSPSASSSSSTKLYKRQASSTKQKSQSVDVFPAVTLPEFPSSGQAQLVEAPTFHPSEKEFQDPLDYLEKIRSKAEQFGICRIVPPSTFKPECKVTDDMRFTAYNQFVHKMLHRWGPNFKELMAIRKYLSTQNISLTHPPWIGGMEIDLPRLYQTVQSLGGLKEVIEKKKWSKVSDLMKIPKLAQDRVTKLDDIYCKYLLPYDTLTPAEREKLFNQVETEWTKRESKSLLKAQQSNAVDQDLNNEESDTDDEAEECIVKGRNMALNAFYRIARNTMSMWFKTSEPTAQEVEQEFWKHVTNKQNHICVHSGSIDSGNWGYGFAVSKNSPFARHAWNLKVLTNNSGSVLRSMGPIMGVTVPTLHVGMVFSACCWYRDPHSLPWIEYLHTGGSKIWYGIPDSCSNVFHSVLKKIVPNYCRNKSLWLPSDTVMVPPNILVENGVSLSRIVQEPGQFIVVFQKAFTSSLSTGYVVSESVYFAPPYWLKTARDLFDELRNNCEPSMFSLDRLLLSIVNDVRSNVEVLSQIMPAVQAICDKEKIEREIIRKLGVCNVEKLALPDALNKKKKKQQEDDDYECEICRMNLFISVITESQDEGVYCLKHAVEEIEKKNISSKNCKLMYTYDDQELEGLVQKINSQIESKLQKKVPAKYAGMPTMLNK